MSSVSSETDCISWRSGEAGEESARERGVARLVDRHRGEEQPVQHLAPDVDVARLVFCEEVGLEGAVLLGEGALVGGVAEQPFLRLHLLLDGRQAVDERLLEAGAGEEGGDHNVLQRVAVAGAEHGFGVGAGLFLQRPVVEGGVGGGVEREAGEGEVGHRHAGEDALGVLHQRLVGFDADRAPLVELEERGEVLAQCLAAARVEDAGVDVLFPVADHPGDDHVVVRVLAGQHLVDLQRLVDELRLVEVGVEHLLDAQDQAGAERAFQRAVVGFLRRRVEPAALAEAEALPHRHVRPARRVADGHGAQRVEQRRLRLVEVRVVHCALADQACGADAVFLHGVVHLADQRVVGGEAHPQRRDAHARHQRHGGEARSAEKAVAADAGAVVGDPARLAEDDLGEEVGEEEGAALAGHAGRGRVALPERAGAGADQLVERGAFLRAGCEVEAAQNRVGVVARRLEHARQEVHHRLAQRVELGREAEDQRAPRLVGLGLQPVQRIFRQAHHQRFELARHLGDGILRAVLGLERRAPDDLAFLLAQVAEELAEPLQEVGLGKHHVDREGDLQLVVELDEAGADGVGVGVALGLAHGDEVVDAHREDDAVDRLARAAFAQEIEEGEPGAAVEVVVAVVLGAGILRGVAAGGVDQHRVLGEPPVAVAGSADSLDHRLGAARHQRELQAGVDECGRLPRAGRADDDVPGERIERVALAGLRLLQRRQRVLHPLGEDGAVVGHGLGDTLLQRALLASRTEVAEAEIDDDEEADGGADDGAVEGARQRIEPVGADRRSPEPDDHDEHGRPAQRAGGADVTEIAEDLHGGPPTRSRR